MNSCYLCHLITILCFLVCSQTQLHFLFHLFHLFWRANQLNSENGRRFSCFVFRVSRFASKVGHLWYLMSLSQWFGEVSVCPSGPQTKQPAEGR
jgi:hypothetical protein